MKLTVNAEKLKEMVSKAVKGVGNNKLIPLTSLMCIQVKDNRFTLITTDATNYLYVDEDKVDTDDFYVVVDANVFSKLVAKMTCEKITLEVKEGLNILQVKGNGNYKLELPLDENGAPIKYPDPASKLIKASVKPQTINRSTIQVIIDTLKSALAVTLENPCYTGYYVGDKVVATDTYKIASMGVKLFDKDMLLSPELIDLISVVDEEKIQVLALDSDIVFVTNHVTICGKYMEDIDEYAIDAISGLLETSFDSFCTVPKTALLQVLDRLSLFVGPYDKNAIHLTFTKEGLQISSKAASGVEIIPFSVSDNFKDYTCAIDIQMFMQEVKAIQNDMIELYYGEDNAIKMTDGNITIIVALLVDDMDE